MIHQDNSINVQSNFQQNSPATGNPIPNQNNDVVPSELVNQMKQKNVEVVAVDLHHRHSSQVSQTNIFNQNEPSKKNTSPADARI